MTTGYVGYRPASRYIAMERLDYTVIDVETTGLSPEKDVIIEVSALRVRGNEPAESYTSFINPYRHIPKQITELTGITDVDLLEAPDAELVAEELAAFIGDDTLVAHNATFDMRFLSKLFSVYGMHMENVAYIDTLRLAREAFPDLPNHKLSTLIEELDLGDEQTHRAADDVQVTLQLLLACRKALEDACDDALPETRSVQSDTAPVPRKSSRKKWFIAGLIIGCVGLYGLSLGSEALSGASIFIVVGAIIAIVNRPKNDENGQHPSPVAGAVRQMPPLQPAVRTAQDRIAENRRNGVACCPKCGSTSLTANKKGYGLGKAAVGAVIAGPVGLVGGAVGANKIRVTCLNCGHRFKPGK